MATAIVTVLLTTTILCAGAFYLVGSFLVDMALRRGTATNPDAPPAVFRSAIEGNGQNILSASKPEYAAEDWRIQSFDNLSLCATHLKPKKSSHRWVLLLHGYGLSKEHAWHYSKEYLARDYHVVTPDLRACGDSEGQYITMGALEARDVADWTRRIVEKDPSARIVLHGVSMGAAAVILAEGEDLPKNVVAVVEDSGYADAYSLFTVEIDKILSMPAYPILDFIDLICEHRAGFSFRKAKPLETVRRSSLPTLFIHGTADRLVPFAMMQQLYDASPSFSKEKLVIDKIGHGALYQAKNYFPTVLAFTDKWTGDKSAAP
ncbi:MAG: alpha/beta fold hydrolase [Schwartzia sp.]|nr:alpha/beta fold hydrolase [Schwartzia sp. (in: firmicutes)]